MTEPDFWDDNIAAQKTSQELNELKQTYENFHQMVDLFDESEILLDFLAEDDSVKEELIENYQEYQKESQTGHEIGYQKENPAWQDSDREKVTQRRGLLKYKGVHYNEVAHASAHYEEVEDLVRTEVFMAVIEDWELQCIDDAADRVDDTACQKPAKRCRWESI